jgi:type IV pilus assembly protein PilC
MEGTEIPAFTKAVMAVSDFLQHNIFYLLLGILAVILLLYVAYKKNKFFRTVAQIFVMKLPVFGNTIIYSEVTTFTKTFGSLLSHNVPIVDCMDILNKITDNEVYKMLILDVITNLAKGGKISDSFVDHWAFPVPAYEMIVTGEKTGELAEMMTKVSIYYQDLQKNAVARIKTFIEPALTVFLALATGLIVLSIVIPMFNMYSAVQNMS